ncbi:MAG: hypothetical protein IT374_14895 [Polyangiaceae bacterium]|nr:hypothetical protein [Polyangiaceae bacterium]
MRGNARAALAVLCCAASALADSAAAEVLFREGKKLLAAGDVAGACAKLAESNRLESSSGTLLNLADCHQKQGKTASAWGEFLSASRVAKSQGQAQRSEEAKKRAAALEPKLSFLVVKVAERVPNLKLERDDELIEGASLGTKLPVDPGRHVLAASAPGFKPWTKTFEVKANGDVQEITVPKLEVDASAAPAPTAAPTSSATAAAPTAAPTSDATPPPPPRRKSPTLGYVIGGAGVVLTGVGAFVGLSAMSKYKSADEACPSHKGCAPSVGDDYDSAKSQANVANVAVGLGVVGVAVGAYLVVSSRRSEAAVVVAPSVGPGVAGASVGGRF